MPQLEYEGGVHFLNFFLCLRRHAGVEIVFLIPGTSDVVKQSITQQIFTLIDNLHHEDEHPCLFSSSWKQNSKWFEGEISLLIPRLLEKEVLDSRATITIWATDGLSVSVQVTSHYDSNVVVLQAHETHIGVLRNCPQKISFKGIGSEETWKIQDKAFHEFIQHLLSPERVDKSLNTDDVKNSQMLINFFYQMWGPSDAVTTNELLHCTHQALHSVLHLRNLLPPYCSVSLPLWFLHWLGEDGIHLGELDDDINKKKCSFLSSSDLGDSNQHKEKNGLREKRKESNELQTLVQQIQHKIDGFNSCVIPRILWRTPMDATWISPNHSLECTNAREVLLLLKASSRITEDLQLNRDFLLDVVHKNCPTLLDHTFKSNVSLGLSAVISVNHDFELRVFFYGSRILAVSQKHLEVALPSLQRLCPKDILAAISTFFAETWMKRSFPVDRGALDICLEPKKVAQDSSFTCRLLNLSPWGKLTNPLLFDYDELRALAFRDSADITLRLVGPDFPPQPPSNAFDRFQLDVRMFYGENGGIEKPFSMMRSFNA